MFRVREKNTFKIVSWNCNRAFRNKYQELDMDSLDLLIIQECESPEVMDKKGFGLEYNDYLWIGKDENKGLAAISLNETKIWRDISYNDDFKYILPIRSNRFDELLLCVWTQNTKDKKDSYIAQLVKAIKYYSNQYPGQKFLIIGDFNSNETFDTKFKNRIENHSMLVSLLKEIDIYSIYHHKNNELHGLESKSTHFHRKNLSSKHHIDYAFIPAIYLDDCKFSIGSIDKYLNHSDHLPIFIQLHNLKSQLLTEENYNGKTDLLK